MKSADFNRNEGKIRVLQEVRPGRKNINWDRIIYLVALIGATATIVLMVAKNNLYVKGEGQVLFKKLDIQLTEDVQIVNFLFSEGDSVNIGDTLFYYYPKQALKIPPPIESRRELVITNDNLDWIVRERLTTMKRIELANIQINDARRMVELTESEKKRVEHEIYLDIYPATKLDQYVHRLLDLEHSIVTNQGEIKFLQLYSNYLDAQERIERANAQMKKAYELASYSEVPLLKSYVSPVRGTITQVFKEDFEVALVSETVLSIHKPTNLFIKAFYDQKDIKYLSEGDIVDVKFPDGSTSMGVLQRFYFATYQLPEEFQKKYEPTTRSIAADIIPINEMELEKWKAFYKLNVIISKPIFSTS